VLFDTWIEAGLEVSAHYDPMLAKLIERTGATREEARARMAAAVAASRIADRDEPRYHGLGCWPTPDSPPRPGATRDPDEFDYRPSTIEVWRGR